LCQHIYPLLASYIRMKTSAVFQLLLLGTITLVMLGMIPHLQQAEAQRTFYRPSDIRFDPCTLRPELCTFNICVTNPEVCEPSVPPIQWPFPGCLSCPPIVIDPSRIAENEGIVIQALPNGSILIAKHALNETQPLPPGQGNFTSIR
jgi:hypothetical protein